MMFANVLLINLLVALFATTYERVQENSENIWKLNRYDLILEYWGKSPLRYIVAIFKRFRSVIGVLQMIYKKIVQQF